MISLIFSNCTSSSFHWSFEPKAKIEKSDRTNNLNPLFSFTLNSNLNSIIEVKIVRKRTEFTLLILFKKKFNIAVEFNSGLEFLFYLTGSFNVPSQNIQEFYQRFFQRE